MIPSNFLIVPSDVFVVNVVVVCVCVLEHKVKLSYKQCIQGYR